MRIRFQCQDCRFSIKVASRHAGRRGKCPECRAVVRVPKRRAEATLAVAHAPSGVGRVSPWKDCGACGESVRAVASKCRHCGEWFDAAVRRDARGKEEAPGLVQTVFTASGFIVVGLAALSVLMAMLAVVDQGGGAIIPALIRCVVAYGVGRVAWGLHKRERISFVLFGCLGVFALLVNAALLLSGARIRIGGMSISSVGFFLNLIFNAAVYATPIVFGIRHWSRIRWSGDEA